MIIIPNVAKHVVIEVTTEAKSRSFRASNVLRNAELQVLAGQRSGRVYRVPFTGPGQYVTKSGKIKKKKPKFYTASAPGEPPAVRTGTLRRSWIVRPHATQSPKGTIVQAAIVSQIRLKTGRTLADTLENGAPNLKPRPFRKWIQKMAMPNIVRIYRQKYPLK
jgi:hypothetical protein